MIRPEHLELVQSDTVAENVIEAELVHVSDRGVYLRLELDAGVRLIAYWVPRDERLELTPGRNYAVRIPPEKVHVLAPSAS